MANNRYNVPEQGATDWHIPLNENFERLDVEVEIRNLRSTLDDYTPDSGAKFLATDTGDVFLGDGEQWNTIGTISGGGGGGDATVESTAAYSVYVREEGDSSYAAYTADGSQILGSSDAATALQAGIDVCPSGGSIRVVGRYDIDRTITLGDGKRLVGYDAEWIVSDTSDNIYFSLEICEGSKGANEDLASDAVARDNEIELDSVSGFSEGDHIYIERDDTFDSGKSTGMQYSEKHLIDRIDSSNNTLILSEGVYFDYPTSDNARVTQIEPDTGHVEGFTVRNENNDDSGNYRFANAIRGHKPTYKNLILENVGRTGLSFDGCYGGMVTGCSIHGIRKDSSGYGVRIRSGSANTLISNNTIGNCRHAIAHNYGGSGNGQPRKTLITGNHLVGDDRGATLDAHEGTLDWMIIGNHINGDDNSAITDGAKDCYIYNNVFFGTESFENQGSFYNIRGKQPDGMIHIRGNALKYPGRLGGIWLNRDTVNNINISDNYIRDSQYYGIRIQTDIGMLTISGNTFDNTERQSEASESIFFEDAVEGVEAANISNNTFRTYTTSIATESGVSGISNFTITENNFYSAPWENGDECLDMGVLSDSVIANNTFHDPDGNLNDVITLGSRTENNLIRNNNFLSSGSINDSGTSNVLSGNYQHDGSGWSQF